MISFLCHFFSWFFMSVAVVSPSPTPSPAVSVSISSTPRIVRPVATPTPIPPSHTPTPTPSRTPTPSPSPTPTSTLAPAAKAVSAKLSGYLAKPSVKAFLKLCTDAKTLKMPTSLIVESLGKDRKTIVRTQKPMVLADLLPQCTIASTTQFIGAPKDVIKLITAPLRTDDTDARRLAILNYNIDVQTRLATKDTLVIFSNAARGTTNSTITQMTFTVIFPETGFRALLDMVNKGTLTDLTEKERVAFTAKSGGPVLKFFAASDLQPTIWYETPPTRSW